MKLKAARAQIETCRRFAQNPSPVGPLDMVGASRDLHTGTWPLNGLRHRPEGGTSGWYLWAGQELSEDDDFFQALHVEHLSDRCPDVLPYLALPPGWRFLIAPGYADVWFDSTLLT